MKRPCLSDDDISQLVKRLYGMTVSRQRPLDSYDDVNVHVTTTNGASNEHIDTVCADGYVVKVLNFQDSQLLGFVDAMHAAISVSLQNGIVTPRPVMNVTGNYYSLEQLPTEPHNGSPTCAFLVRLFEYIPGEVLRGKPYTPHLYHSVGRLAGRLDAALQGLKHPGFAGHARYWSLSEVENLNIEVLNDGSDRQIVRDVVREFQQNVATNYHLLQKGVIHGDFNDNNLLVRPTDKYSPDDAAALSDMEPCNKSYQPSFDVGNSSSDLHKSKMHSDPMDNTCNHYTVHAILDYGDSMEGYHVFEVAIAMMYMMTQCKTGDAVDAAGHVLAGYLQEFKLPALDISLLKECICGRLAQSLVNGELKMKKDPTNEYCRLNAVLARPRLHTLWHIPNAELRARWQAVLNIYPGNLSC